MPDNGRSTEQRLAELEAAAQKQHERWWRVQGRLNALEIIAVTCVFDRAAMTEHPRAWVVQFVDQIRNGTLKTLIADVSVAKGDEKRLKQEVVTALEEVLEELLMRSANDVRENNPFAIWQIEQWRKGQGG